MKKIIDLIKQQVLPGYYANRVNKRLQDKYIECNNSNIDISLINTGKENYINELKKELDSQLKMKEQTENKAKSLLFVIGVVIAAFSFSISFLTSLSNNVIKIVLVVTLILSVINLLSGVIRALQAINIKKFNIYQIEIKRDNGIYILQPNDNIEQTLKSLIKSKILNELINTSLANYVYASFTLIRNGIILFLLFFILSIVFS